MKILEKLQLMRKIFDLSMLPKLKWELKKSAPLFKPRCPADAWFHSSFTQNSRRFEGKS